MRALQPIRLRLSLLLICLFGSLIGNGQEIADDISQSMLLASAAEPKQSITKSEDLLLDEPERSYWFSKSKSKWPITFDVMASVGVGTSSGSYGFSFSPSNTAKGKINVTFSTTSYRFMLGNLYASVKGEKKAAFGWMIEYEQNRTAGGEIQSTSYTEGSYGFGRTLDPFYDGKNFYNGSGTDIKEVLEHSTSVEGYTEAVNVKFGARIFTDHVTFSPYMGIGAGGGSQTYTHYYTYLYNDGSQRSGRASISRSGGALTFRLGCAVNFFRYFYVDPFFGGFGFLGTGDSASQAGLNIHLGVRVPLADW